MDGDCMVYVIMWQGEPARVFTRLTDAVEFLEERPVQFAGARIVPTRLRDQAEGTPCGAV